MRWLCEESLDRIVEYCLKHPNEYPIECELRYQSVLCERSY